MDTSVLTQHLLISLAPWLVAVIIAGALGTVWALAARSLFSRVPAQQRASILLPWRTVAVGLPLLSPLVAPQSFIRQSQCPFCRVQHTCAYGTLRPCSSDHLSEKPYSP